MKRVLDLQMSAVFDQPVEYIMGGQDGTLNSTS